MFSVSFAFATEKAEDSGNKKVKLFENNTPQNKENQKDSEKMDVTECFVLECEIICFEVSDELLPDDVIGIWDSLNDILC